MTVERALGEVSRSAPYGRLADVLRPEVAGLATAIVDEIQARVPACARPLDGPGRDAVRAGVQHAITLFLARLADRNTPGERAHRAHAGPDLAALRAAYRVAVRVSWQRIVRAGRRGGLSPAAMSQLADVLLTFLDELAAITLEGCLEAKTATAGALENWRRRLLHLILQHPPASADTIAGLAALSGWKVPAEITVIAVQCSPDLDRVARLDPDILAETAGPQPCLLVPGLVCAQRLASLRAGLPSAQLAVGPPVPLCRAADSLRWSRRVLLLVHQGVLPAQPVIWVADQLSTLVLHADAGLVAQLRQQLFAPLEPLTSKQRARMVETLRAWLQAQGNVLEAAEKLQVHPQTIRYRMRQLHATFGERLNDPRSRFELELILRAESELPPSPADAFPGLFHSARPHTAMVPGAPRKVGEDHREDGAETRDPGSSAWRNTSSS